MSDIPADPTAVRPDASSGNVAPSRDDAEVRGLIGWFAKNHVAANLMMIGIIGLGVYSLWWQIKKESFPEFNRNQIQIQVPFRGERSMQAQIVMPMAVSLAFGIVFATLITLILIPCLYSIQENMRQVVRRFFLDLFDRHPEAATQAPATTSPAVSPQGSALR